MGAAGPLEAAGSGLGAPSAVSTRCLLGRLQGRWLSAATRVLVVLSKPCPGTRAGGDASTQPLSPLGPLCVSAPQPLTSRVTRSTERRPGAPVRAAFRDQQTDTLGLGVHSRVRVCPNPLHGCGQYDSMTGPWPEEPGSPSNAARTGPTPATRGRRGSGGQPVSTLGPWPQGPPHWHPEAPSGRSSQPLSSSQ